MVDATLIGIDLGKDDFLTSPDYALPDCLPRH